MDIFHLILFMSSIITLQSQASSTTQIASSDGVQVEMIPWQDYVPLDANWEIVQSYWTVEYDLETGQMQRVFYERRVAPPGYRPPDEVIQAQCRGIAELLATQENDIRPAFDCQFEAAESITRRSADNRVPGSDFVRNTLKSYANKYCDRGDCGLTQFFAMWRDETHWYRTSTHWTVSNAVHRWGCPATCVLCTGTIFDTVREYTIGTVRWQCPDKCRHSTVYGFNYVWPAGAENSAGMNPKSVVRYNTNYDNIWRKTKSTVVNWN